jgi:hypothetical protein
MNARSFIHIAFCLVNSKEATFSLGGLRKCPHHVESFHVHVCGDWVSEQWNAHTHEEFKLTLLPNVFTRQTSMMRSLKDEDI